MIKYKHIMQKSDFIKINDYLWEIPKTFRGDMRVPARVYASEKILDDIFKDRSISQLINVATLPGIVNYSMAMPDMHEGYGFPIGGVAAMRLDDGVISPGGVGYDINCGMKLLKSEYKEEEIRPYLDKLATAIQKEVPSGLGQGRQIKLDIKSIDKILEGGAQTIMEQGYGQKDDLKNCESEGRLTGADAAKVSSYAKNRGRDQVGTLGSGNHFLEIQKVDEIFDETTAQSFGLFKNQVVVMIHTGSRGLGHQIATDYIRVMMQAMDKYKIKLPDRELAACPINSPEGKDYFAAMACGANFAWANRQMITHFIRGAWQRILGQNAALVVLYDVAHNMAKFENNLCVHRKGATRAFPGQPVLIPGSMGTASYVLVGIAEGEQSFYSTNHGAGRVMSRHEAMRRVSGEEVVQSLKAKGIIVKCRSSRGIAEEAPLAYKNIDNIVEVVHNVKLSKKVVRLTPLAVIKGE